MQYFQGKSVYKGIVLPRVTLPEQIRVSGRLLLGRSVRSL